MLQPGHYWRQRRGKDFERCALSSAEHVLIPKIQDRMMA